MNAGSSLALRADCKKLLRQENRLKWSPLTAKSHADQSRGRCQAPPVQGERRLVTPHGHPQQGGRPGAVGGNDQRRGHQGSGSENPRRPARWLRRNSATTAAPWTRLPAARVTTIDDAEVRVFALERLRVTVSFIASLYRTAWQDSLEVKLPSWLDRKVTANQ